MAIDPQRLGTLALEFMEQIENEHGPEATVDAIAFIAAVDTGDGETTTHFIFKDGVGDGLARYRSLGLLEEVSRNI